MALTIDQQKVVDSKSMNMLVSAGAGSGKTTVITKRVIELLKTHNYKFENLIILTFTDLAAKQMKDKILDALK